MSFEGIKRKGEELIERAHKDLSIDKSMLMEESLRTPNIHSDWMKLLFQWKDLLRGIDNKYKEIYKERWVYYSGKADSSVYRLEPFDFKVLKGDISIFLDSDQRLSNIRQQIDLVKDIVGFIEATIGEINRRSFHIKNAISWLQFSQGS